MENRSGLVRDVRITASGHGDRDVALAMVKVLPGRRRRTLGMDKGYDSAEFVANCRVAGVTLHVVQNTSNRCSAIDCRTRHGGYAVSLKMRAWIETHFGWLKSAAGMRQVKQRGIDKGQGAVSTGDGREHPGGEGQEEQAPPRKGRLWTTTSRLRRTSTGCPCRR